MSMPAPIMPHVRRLAAAVAAGAVLAITSRDIDRTMRQTMVPLRRQPDPSAGADSRDADSSNNRQPADRPDP